MLSYFDSITVPGLEKITVYRDDEDAYRFYVMPSTPRLARDDQGQLLLTLMIYAQNVDTLPPEQLEAQRGWVAASVELRLTPDEETKVRDHLRDLINSGAHLWFARFLHLDTTPREPKITLPPEWVSGTVTLSTPTPGGSSSVATSKPSLISTNVATLAGDLSQDASELLRQSVLKGGMPMAVSYNDLTFVARIPSIKVHIHGDRSAFMSECIQRYQIEHNTVGVETIDYGFLEWTRVYWTSYTTNHTSVSDFSTQTQSITLDIDDTDFRTDPEAAAAKAKFEEMALNIFSNSVVPSIMADVSKQFDAAKAALGAGADPNATPPPCSVQSVVANVSGNVDIQLSKSSVIQVAKNPNGSLAQDLTTDEIKKAITYIDLSDPYFKEMFLRVHANVNFERDPVFGLKVNVVYDQSDDQIPHPVKGSKSMLFTSADQVQTFRQILARGSDGKTKDSYQYWSEIIYKETGQTIRVPSSGMLTASESELVISYRSLGFVKVGLTLAPQPEEVTSVRVTLNYPRSTLPSATQTIELSTATPIGTYFTYTGHDGDPDPYSYSIVYVLKDGQQMDVPAKTDRAEQLVIPNPFEGRTTANFVAQADFTVVDKVIVDATYADPANDLTTNFHAELASNGASSPWSVALRDPSKLQFTFQVTVLFKNGSSEQHGPTTATLGQTVLVGIGAIDALDVLLVPNLDSAHTTAVVQLEYTDQANGVHQTQNFQVTNASTNLTFHVLLRDPNARSYRYRIQLLSTPTAPAWDSGWQTSTDTVLLVRGADAASPTPSPTSTSTAGG